MFSERYEGIPDAVCRPSDVPGHFCPAGETLRPFPAQLYAHILSVAINQEAFPWR